MEHYLYRKVWTPDGKMFEVNPERAADLVLNKGWSNTPPVTERPRKKRGKKAEKVEQAPATETVDNLEEVETEAPASEDNE